MPELLQIEMLRTLRRLDAELGIAPRTTATGHVVLALGFVGQGKESFENLVGRIDLGLWNAVIADAGEAPLAVRGAQLGHESVAIAVKAGNVEGGDLAHSDSWLVRGGYAGPRLWPG